MSEREFFNVLLAAWFALAAVMFFALLRLPAPYGRHSRAGWGVTVQARAGWLVMEAPASLLFAVWFAASGRSTSVTLLVFFLMWQAHYVQRAFIYPFTLGSTRRIPLVVVLTGVLFNGVNTYLNGRHLFAFSGGYGVEWLHDPRFVAGAAVFAAGYALNRWADATLRSERVRSGLTYCRVDRGIFRYVCCPNYLGEIAIWSGWALATWSLAGLSFAAWTAANLLPRGRTHLAWSRANLPRYPAGRKAVLPGLW